MRGNPLHLAHPRPNWKRRSQFYATLRLMSIGNCPSTLLDATPGLWSSILLQLDRCLRIVLRSSMLRLPPPKRGTETLPKAHKLSSWPAHVALIFVRGCLRHCYPLSGL
ncbi:hypothetical protein BDN70DRAFT_991478 [Pholiota conissans]|uniref:Uncharacterized protein n=1 Tax=Pholiota conissans TaxID=109636 RepID=A0A9P6D3U7_9AGAR|nr:hypothetical protein BDN70DRAFT_991478 [Pholiota conissans]